MTDLLPVSQSPVGTPKPSPAGQQRGLSHTQDFSPNCSFDSQPEDHIFQLGVPSPSTPLSVKINSSSGPELQQHARSTAQRVPNVTASIRQNEQKNSNSYQSSEALSRQTQGFPRRIRPSSQTDTNLSIAGPCFRARQPGQLHNRPLGHQQNVHESQLHKTNRLRPSSNTTSALRYPQSARMASPLKTRAVRHSFQHQNPHHQSVNTQGHQQQYFRNPQHEQRPVYSKTNPANLNQSVRMTTPGFSNPTVRPTLPQPIQLHQHSPGQVQETRVASQNPLHRPNSNSGKAMQQHLPLKTDNFLLDVPSASLQHNQHQRLPRHRQDMKPDDRVLGRRDMLQHEFEHEELYDEDNEDYNEDIDEDQMPYPGYSGFHDYGYHSSDSDGLSEEESALLDELRWCDDDERYLEIIDRLQEKGVDPDEIEELLCHSNDPEDMYSDENYEDEDEAEGIVSSSSSSSHGPLPAPQNPQRPALQAGPSRGDAQSMALSSRLIGQNQKAPGSAPSAMHCQKGAHTHNISSMPTDGASQHGKASGFRGSQQQVSAIRPPAPVNTASLWQSPQPPHQHGHQQQSRLKLLGQKRPLSPGSQATQSVPHTDIRQPHQAVVRTQPHLRPEDPRHLAGKESSILEKSERLQTPKSNAMNRPPQSSTEAHVHTRVAKPQVSSHLPGVRQAQDMASVMNNSQTIIPGQAGESQSFVASQTAPSQQQVIRPASTNHPSGLSETPSVHPAKAPLQLQQKHHGQQSISGTSLGPGQDCQKPPTRPASDNIKQQNLLHSSQLQSVLNKNTAPSEASIARQNVELMQQSLEREIMAKKGVRSAPAHSPSPRNPQTQDLRLSSPHGHTAQPLQLQKHENQNVPACQQQPQLSSCQPVPTIDNVNPSTSQTFSSSKPICSVVPFTSENQAQITAADVQSLITPQQNEQPPPSLPPQNNTNSLLQPFQMFQSRTNTSSGPNSHESLSADLNRNPVSENVPLIPNQNSTPRQVQQHHPSAQSSNRHDALSLDHLSEDKCIFTGKGKKQSLVVNRVYQIRSPVDGSLALALWNGHKFEDLKQAKVKGHPGLVSVIGAQSSAKPTSDVQKALKRQTAAPKPSGAAASSQSTYMKPLTQGHTQHRSEQQMDDESDDDDDDSIFKKPFNEDEDYFRVCQHCGCTSKNFRRCESCQRIFQGEVKLHCLKRQMNSAAVPLPGSRAKMSSKPQECADMPATKDVEGFNQEIDNGCGNANIRGRGRGGFVRTRGGLKERMIVKRTTGDDYETSEPEDSSASENINSDGSESSYDGPGKRRPVQLPLQSPAPKKRSKNISEPVTLTISSDEDEPSSTTNTLSSLASIPAISADSESSVYPSAHSGPFQAPGRFGPPLMEDEEEISKSILQQIEPPYMDWHEDEEEEDEDDDGEDFPIYEIDIRSVRVGSMRTQSEGPLLINLQGVFLKVRSERTEETFECEILDSEVEKVKYFFGEAQPVLFLFLTQDCGEKLRAVFHMEAGDDEFIDPSSTDMKQKMVVIIIECFNYMLQEMLQETFSIWADRNHVDDECFIEELTEESSNDLLIQSAPPVLAPDVGKDIARFKQRTPGSSFDSIDNEPDSTSSSPPEIRHHYYGSPVRLLQYPPPPAKRLSITTEDLFCLKEGEFLNDVIIDFYLQYLYHEKLSEENRRRTHIFSSFFYRRLTQRDRHSEKPGEGAKNSLPERRHGRVKKWTKTVDLFSKDFVIVPINENSHWYLAVVCFPGLASQEVVPFIPRIAYKGEADDVSNDAHGGEEGTNEEETGSQGSMSKTILGLQLDAKKCLDNEDSKYNIGQNQPCILMFDSLAGPSRNQNIRMLKDYFQCEWNAKKSEPREITTILQSCSPNVPQQSNYSDCGVYLLQYVESFFENPIADFEIPMKGLEHWFPKEHVHNKRKEIHDLIMTLHKRFQKERGDPNILHLRFESTPREPTKRFQPNHEINSRSEERMSSGFKGDDDNSNSAASGEMCRSEPVAVAATAMVDDSYLEGEDQEGYYEGADREEEDEGC